MDKLSNAKIGKTYKIKGYSQVAPIKIKRRILELGFTQNQEVKVVAKSLLGKTFLIELRGFVLTVRKDIANLIFV